MDHQPMVADDAFFSALMSGDGGALQQILGEDFTIIDVMRGGEADRGTFIEGVSSGLVRFDHIEPSERRVRSYDGTAVIVGRTTMRGSFMADPFVVSSRYTHVFVRDRDRAWRLVSAQGTPIEE